MTDAAKAEQQARSIRAQAADMLADADTPKDARTAATVAESMAKSVLWALGEGEHLAAAYTLGQAADAIETARRWRQFWGLWPDAKRGQDFRPRKPDAANRQRSKVKTAREQHIIDTAKRLLGSKIGRYKNGGINQSRLAHACLKVIGPELKERRVREILAKAIHRGELA